MDELKRNMREKLNKANIYELREFAKKHGVKSPTTLSKSELIAEIIYAGADKNADELSDKTARIAFLRDELKEKDREIAFLKNKFEDLENEIEFLRYKLKEFDFLTEKMKEIISVTNEVSAYYSYINDGRQ